MLFDNAPQGVAILSPDGRIQVANRALGALIGMAPELLSGHNLSEYVVGSTFRTQLEKSVEDPSRAFHSDIQMGALDGTTKSVALSFRMMVESRPSTPVVLVNAVDITERQELHSLVAFMAAHDELTSLMNRRAFDGEMHAALDRFARGGEDASLLLLDMDNFKVVNASFGHVVGDKVIIELANLLKEVTTDGQYVGRLGGDEFAILLPGTSRDDALA